MSSAGVRGISCFFPKITFFLGFPTTWGKKSAQTRRGREANKIVQRSQDARNTAFTTVLGKDRTCVDLYRFSGSSEMQRLREPCKVSLLPDYSFSHWCFWFHASRACLNRSILVLHLGLQNMLLGQNPTWLLPATWWKMFPSSHELKCTIRARKSLLQTTNREDFCPIFIQQT